MPETEKKSFIETRAGHELATLPTKGFVLAPQSFEEAFRIAQMVASSALVPKDYRGKPEDCFIAMSYGAELGLPPMASLQGIAVINGRPTLFGDALLGVIMAHAEYAGKKEWIEGEGEEMVAHCIIWRNIPGSGSPEETHTVFSVDDAKLASLWQKRGYDNKATPWVTHPKRMMQMRARGFSVRDAFPDVLRGVITTEEAMDMSEGAPQRPGTTADFIQTQFPEAAFEGSIDWEVTTLAAELRWTGVRLKLELQGVEGNKAELLARLQLDKKSAAERSNRHANRTAPSAPSNDAAKAEEAADEPPEAPTLFAADAKMSPATRSRLFAILGELGLTAKPKRIEWVKAHGVAISSFTELLEAQARELADVGQAQIDGRRAQAAEEVDEEKIINESGDDCAACLAPHGKAHVDGCPEAFASK